MHLKVFPAEVLARPIIPTESIFLFIDIFEMLVLPQVGHFGILASPNLLFCFQFFIDEAGIRLIDVTVCLNAKYSSRCDPVTSTVSLIAILSLK